ncbi:MAG: hypothetical protein JW993_20025 [Sedimentisphaerales bacterium]|nr:hypothetical protein [Sedimentisphaerales bacterium]
MLEQFGTTNAVILAVYLAGMVAIGLVLAGRQKTTEDYFLAGRKMPWLAVGMSMFASLTSATTYMGVPAFAYRHNVAMMGLLAVVYTVLGGLSAVIWTDVVQFIILTGGAVWLIGTLLVHVPGGAAEIVRIAAEAGKLDVFDWTDLSRLTILSATIGWFFVFLNDYGTDQVTVQRLLAVRDDKGVVQAIVFNAVNDLLINGMLTRRAHFVGWLVGAGGAITLTLLLQRFAGDWLMTMRHFPISFAVTTAIGYTASLCTNVNRSPS